MEIQKEILVKELYQVACMLERARKPEAVKLFSEKEYLRQELEKMWIILGPHHPSCFHLFKILKKIEDKYKALITGKVK